VSRVVDTTPTSAFSKVRMLLKACTKAVGDASAEAKRVLSVESSLSPVEGKYRPNHIAAASTEARRALEKKTERRKEKAMALSPNKKKSKKILPKLGFDQMLIDPTAVMPTLTTTSTST
jgi:N12 class adenine-specific DNA methylase